MRRLFILLVTLLAVHGYCLAAIRLKELVTLEGVRDNQLMGYGLVVGLNGTGDKKQTEFSIQSVVNLLERMGITVSASTVQVKNTASVMITATLPPYSQPGSKIDVTISALGDASSLQGGVLLMAGLKGPDGQVYAVAQGPMVIGGLVAGGGGNTSVLNHPTVGRIPNGAIVEKSPPSLPLGPVLHLQLQRADFSTAVMIAEAVNKHFEGSAHADNSALISVAVPEKYLKETTSFVAQLEQLTVEPDRDGKIVVNERTGTIILGKDVHISPVAIMHGNLNVEVQTTQEVSQPNPMSGGSTQVVPQVSLGVKQDAARNLMLKNGATVEELVQALSSIGATPRDIISILQTLKSAGALEADLEVI